MDSILLNPRIKSWFILCLSLFLLSTTTVVFAKTVAVRMRNATQFCGNATVKHSSFVTSGADTWTFFPEDQTTHNVMNVDTIYAATLAPTSPCVEGFEFSQTVNCTILTATPVTNTVDFNIAVDSSGTLYCSLTNVP